MRVFKALLNKTAPGLFQLRAEQTKHPSILVKREARVQVMNQVVILRQQNHAQGMAFKTCKTKDPGVSVFFLMLMGMMRKPIKTQS